MKIEKMKRIAAVLAVVLALVLAAAFFAACGEDEPTPDPEPSDAELTAIAVTAPTKTEYAVGDEFDPSGIVVTAEYSDGSSKTVTGYTLSEPDMSTAGEKTVTVTYSEGGVTKTAAVKIVVQAPPEPEKTLESVEITTEPTLKTYTVGDTLDTAGMVVTAKYDDGSAETVTDYTVFPDSFTEAGQIVVTVSYGGKTDTFTVTVGNALTAVTATLNDGVVYYANGKAVFDKSDLTVTAHYGNEEKTLTADEFSVSVPADFASNGGTVTVTYDGMTAQVTVTLTPVKAVSAAVKTQPDKMAYTAGDMLDLAGLVVTVTYNDGSVRDVFSGFTHDKNAALTEADTKVTVACEGVTVELTITVFAAPVVPVLERVEIRAEGLTVAEGTSLRESDIAVYGVYDNGNSERLTDGYTVTLPESAARLGLKYTVSVSADGSLTDSADIPVTAQYEGENATIVGGAITTEDEYRIENGEAVNTGEEITFAGGFAKSAQNGDEASITFIAASAAAGTADLTMRCGNSYLMFDETNGYYMAALQINQVADLTVNGAPVEIGNDVRLSATSYVGTGENDWQGLYNVYSEFTFGGVPLRAGLNLIKLSFRWNNELLPNYWDESPSTMNIDWMRVAMTGADEPSGDVSSISVDENYSVSYGDSIAAATGTVLAEYDNGTYVLDPSAYDVAVSGRLVSGEEIGETFDYGVYTLTFTLKADDTKTAGYTAYIEYCRVRSADVIVENGRAYYVFGFDSVGYTEEDYEFFGDESVVYPVESSEFDDMTATFRIDVTDVAVGMIYPHLRIEGENYVNGVNGNGDLVYGEVDENNNIVNNYIEFTEGKSVTLGGKTYTLTEQYGMPALSVTAAA